MFSLYSFVTLCLPRSRWTNLWVPATSVKSFAGCTFEGNEAGSLLFVGNLALVAGILLFIFFLHIAVVSGVEAKWLAKVIQSDQQAMARCGQKVHVILIPVLLCPFRGYCNAWIVSYIHVLERQRDKKRGQRRCLVPNVHHTMERGHPSQELTHDTIPSS